MAYGRKSAPVYTNHHECVVIGKDITKTPQQPAREYFNNLERTLKFKGINANSLNDSGIHTIVQETLQEGNLSTTSDMPISKLMNKLKNDSGYNPLIVQIYCKRKEETDSAKESNLQKEVKPTKEYCGKYSCGLWKKVPSFSKIH